MYNKILLTFFSLFLSVSLMAQITITGYVLDETNEPLIGATILVKNTKTGITTDYEGYFELVVPSDNNTLVVSYFGYESQEIEIKRTNEILRIILESSVSLNEVLVLSADDERHRSEKEEDEIIKSVESGSVTYAWTEETKATKKKDKRKSKETYSISTAPAASAPATEIVTADITKVLEGKSSGIKVEKIEATGAYEDLRMEMDEVADVIVSDAEITLSDKSMSGDLSDLPEAGQLTAGIINDYGKWNLWQDIQENELKSWQETWVIRPWNRYPVQLTTQNGYPIVNAQVKLMDNEIVLWTTKTDNTGKAELWANLYEDKDVNNYNILVSYNGNEYEIDNAQDFHEGGNTKVLPVQCNIPKIVDIAFVVDATGSMGDEISYLKSELTDVITRSKEALEDTELRLGSVFYRDLGDAYVTRKSHFSTDISKTVKFIEQQGAAGGGDGPEAIEEAFDVALDNMVWSEDASARLMFLVLDAPPHQTPEIKERLKTQIAKAAEMGIRIIPVACSGTDRSTEYLMRSFALATNGSYIYLTDDSGIGGSHQKPITDEIKVNLLNDLLVQTITDFSTTVSCDEQLDYVDEEIQDTMEVSLYVQDKLDPNGQQNIVNKTEFAWKYYPNPCGGLLWVEIEGDLEHLYLFDGAGKLLRRITITENKLELDLSMYPSGVYYLRGIGKDEREVSGKVVLTRTY